MARIAIASDEREDTAIQRGADSPRRGVVRVLTALRDQAAVAAELGAP